MVDKQSGDRLLDECLAARQRGEPVEAILAREPAQADETRQELAAAEWLQAHQEELDPPAGFLEASKTRLMKRVRPANRLSLYRRRSLHWGNPMYRWALAAVFLIGVFPVLQSLYFSALTALPGDSLYGAKRSGEELRWFFTFDRLGRAELGVSLAQERSAEIEALVLEGRYEDIMPVIATYQEQWQRAYRSVAEITTRQPENAQDLNLRLDQAYSTQRFVLSLLLGSVPEYARIDVQVAMLVAAR